MASGSLLTPLRPEVRTRLQIGLYGNMLAALTLHGDGNQWWYFFVGLATLLSIAYSLTEDQVDEPEVAFKPSTSYQYRKEY